MGSDKRERQVADRNRFNQQCFLADNWKLLSYRNQADLEAARTKSGPFKGYRNFVSMLGSPGEIIHKLASKPDVKDLMEITPAQSNLLVPYIKIYRVDYSIQQSKGEDKELIFDGYTTKDSIENILTNRRGRGEDVGLKSFTYKFAGRNPAEGGTAEAQLEIYFQNISALLREPADPSFQASFKDLIMPEGRWKKNTGDPEHRVWNNKHFRIKIVAGWSVPADPGEVLITPSLRKAIERSKTVLFMALKSHELNFGEDGSATLTVNYQGAMEAALDSQMSNIFWATRDREEAERLRKKNDEVRTSRKQPSADGQSRPKALEDDDKNKVEHGGFLGDSVEGETAEDREVNRNKKRAIELEELDKQKIWSRIIDGLMTRSRIYYIDVKQSVINGLTEKQEDFLEDYEEQFTSSEVALLRKTLAQRSRRLLQNRQGLKKSQIVAETYKKNSEMFVGRIREPSTLKSFKGAKENIGELANTERGFLFAKTTSANTEEVNEGIAENALENKAYKVSGGKLRVNFFFFGDLMDVVLDALTQGRDDTHNMNVLLGSIALFDPRNPDQKDPYYVNLADIPISLDLFITWYMETVVKQQRTKYYLKSFIKDAINKLVTPALGEQCFVEGSRFSSRVSMTTLTLPGVSTGDIKTSLGTRITPQTLEDSWITKNIKDESASHKKTSDLANFLYIYVSNYPMRNLKGNRVEDESRGIYHLTVGADRGLVKTIKFKKQDQPYVAEERATSDSADNKRLRDRYNASITMIGNNLFKPGQYVYVDTQAMSNELGSPLKENNIAFQLGLGGYFQVKEVDYTTDSDTHETEIDCQWIHANYKVKQSPVSKKSAAVLRKFQNLQKKVDKK
jgi:hypothetical protein